MRSKVATAITVLACLFAYALPPGAGAAPANFAGASSDGKVIFFATSDKLVPGDTDGRLDVYERSFDPLVDSHVTRVVSTGPVGGNDAFDAFHGGISTDGSKAFFSTEERLVAGDTDRAEDVYVRNLDTGITALVTVGASPCAPSCGNGNQGAAFFDASADGSRVDFITAERLAPADTDTTVDVYERNLSTGATTLVSRGGEACSPVCGNGNNDALFQGASADGSKVYFATAESLVSEDADDLGDIYQRDLQNGTTALISRSGVCPSEADCTPAFGGATADGSHVFFETRERIDGGDSDNASDVYDWSSGAVSLVSSGPTGGNGTANATYEGSAAAGATVFFRTAESLVATDADSSVDVYARATGTTNLVSTGPEGGNADLPVTFAKASADGATVLFSTAEVLASTDGDTQIDVYSRSAGETTLVSTAEGAGNGPFDSSYAGASTDAMDVYFETSEPLVEEDVDTRPDVYLRAGEATELVSTGPIGQSGSFTPNLSDVSADGSHAIFITEERLAEGDLDTERDVYDRAPSGTLLVSVGNLLQLGPPTPALTGTNPASPNPSTTPAVLGQSDAGTSIKIYSTPDCSGVPVGTGSAAELGGPGIPVVVKAEVTTVMRATATDANGDTSACSSSSVSYRQAPEPPPGEEGGGDPGGGDPGSGGSTGGSGSTGGKRPGGGRGGDGGGGKQAVTPRTRVTFAPLFKTRSRRPTIGFADATEQEGTVFFCKVDKQRWRSCRSPMRLKKLSFGRHAFRVKGFNSGLWEAKPAVRRFQVVRR